MRVLHYLSDQNPAVNDAALTILRVAVAVIFIAHGAGDIFEAGIGTNIGNYQDAGIPLAVVAAPFAALTQFVGGFLLIVGLLSRLVGAGLVVVMAGALLFVHAGEPIPIGQDGSGSGFALAMGAASLAILLLGPGRWSLDHAIRSRLSPAEQPVGSIT